MNRPIQQHFVTRAYLQGFADEKGQLHIYERGKQKPFVAVADKAARQRNYYSVKGKDGKFDDRIETFLDEQVESPAMKVLKDLSEKGDQPSWDDRISLARWMAFQELRTPLQRGGIEEAAQKLIERIMEMMAATPGALENALEELKKQGREQNVTAERLREGIQADAFSIHINPVLSLEMMTIAEEIAPWFAEMQWTLLTAAEDVAFVTSDHPVLRNDPDEHSPYRYGFMSGTIEFGLPLTARKFLSITRDHEREMQWENLMKGGNEEQARELRTSLPTMASHMLDGDSTWKLKERIIRSAPRFIYCPDEDTRYVEFLSEKAWTLRWHTG